MSTSTSKFTNNMYTYLPDAKEDDDVTIVTNNKTTEQEKGAWDQIIKDHPLSQSPHSETMFNTSYVNIAIDQAI